MIKILLLTAFVMLNAGGEKFLQEIALYQKDSYFKEKVYAEHDHKSFAQLKEANKVIDPNNYDLHLLNAAIFYATNKIREQKHLPLLKFSSQLRDAAVVHSQQMVAKKFFDHFGKTPALRSPDNRIALFGIKDPQALGENIDYNHILLPSNTTYLQLGDALVDEWMHSAPHRKTMLTKGFTHLGCGGYFEEKDKNGARYIKATQDYAHL